MSSPTVYLVNGANRGIGFALVSSLAERSDVIIFAGARDPTKATALKALAEEHPGKVEILQLTSANVEENTTAAKFIERKSGKLDVVIANAGIANHYGPVETTPVEEMREHWETNTLAPLILFQATASLLRKSATPQFVVISTGAASLGAFFPLGATAYTSSKTAVNFIVKSIDAENPWLICNSISPGWAATDMGNQAAAHHGMSEAPVPVAYSIKGILHLMDTANKDTRSGKFFNAVPSDAGRPWDISTEELVW